MFLQSWLWFQYHANKILYEDEEWNAIKKRQMTILYVMYYICRYILFIAFGGCVPPPNQVTRLFCIYKGMNKWIKSNPKSNPFYKSKSAKYRAR